MTLCLAKVFGFSCRVFWDLSWDCSWGLLLAGLLGAPTLGFIFVSGLLASLSIFWDFSIVVFFSIMDMPFRFAPYFVFLGT